MNRCKASTIHFLASACALLCIFLVIRFIWYPGPLFSAASGTDLIAIVILVDLILGPLITLIIFNPKKPGLKFDMACVLVCQIAFMGYGVWSIFEARPTYISFVENRFYLVTANDIDPSEQAKAQLPQYRSLPLLKPEIVGTTQPKDQKTQQDLLFANIFGVGVYNLPAYFVPYSDVVETVKSEAKEVKALKAADSKDLERLTVYAAKQAQKGEKILFLPLISKKKLLYIAINGVTGQVIEIL